MTGRILREYIDIVREAEERVVSPRSIKDLHTGISLRPSNLKLDFCGGQFWTTSLIHAVTIAEIWGKAWSSRSRAGATRELWQLGAGLALLGTGGSRLAPMILTPRKDHNRSDTAFPSQPPNY